MSETANKIAEDWALIVDPKQPAKSLVLYKGEPVANVTFAAMTLEPMPVGDGKMAVLPVLTIKVSTQSLALGTYSAPAQETGPAQQELDLGDKKA